QRMDWLPRTLGPHIRLVASISEPREELVNLRTWISAEQVLHLDPLTRGQGAEIIRSWLAAESRTLTPNQEAAVLDGFTQALGGHGTPLYLRLAFERARAWPSFAPPLTQPASVPALIGEYLSWLEQPGLHGSQLVAHALGLLAAARHGLAEDEALDLL